MADGSSSSSSCSEFSSASELEMDLDPESEEEVHVEEGVQPYLFEPESISLPTSSDEETTSEPSDRRTTDGWCLCGEVCQRQDTERECLCCQEIQKVKEKNRFSAERRMIETPQCVTQNPGFLSNCTDIDVIETSWFTYRQRYGGFDGPEHKRYRYIAYRRFVTWCWGWLGRNIRVILPSCVVSCIRAHFPPPGLEEDFQFEGFRFPDE